LKSFRQTGLWQVFGKVVQLVPCWLASIVPEETGDSSDPGLGVQLSPTVIGPSFE
jgi:hypothetical protein